MKQLLIGLILSLAATHATAATRHLGEWTCIATHIKSGNHEANSRLVLEILNVNGTLELASLIGHVTVGWDDFNDPSSHYYSIFNLKRMIQNTKYKPRVYTNHIQFKNIDEAASNSTDGGGMNGELVIEASVVDKLTQKVSAHYIFQSGDHLGSTIDYQCTK